MRKKAGLAALIMTLASCEVVPVQVPQPTAPSAVQAEPVAELPREQRQMARAFVQVVERLVPVAERECRLRAPQMNCDFHIVIDDNPNQPVNAFQTVDNRGRPIIAFTIALIADAQNPDEIAFVMAHEAAHHIENHLALQRRNARIGAAAFGELAGLTGADPEAIQTAQELGAAVGARTYSKEFELEADRLGTIIAFRAGYDPVLGAQFFFRVPDPGDRFFATHPANADRVRMVEDTAASL